MRQPGIGTLLRLSRAPARAMGLAQLQGFLERGVDAFGRLGDAPTFMEEIVRRERSVAARLFAGDADPFGVS